MKRSRLKNIINKSKTISNKQEIGNPFDEFKKSLPIEVDDNYRLESAWKAYGSPKNYKEALWQGLIQPIDENTVKLPSIGYNKETDEYEYLNKGRENEIVDKDIRVWDNNVIPLVKELKQGGYIRVYDEEKDCWKYSKNQSLETLNNGSINYFKKGGPTKYTNGQKCDTKECALFSNEELRNSGYMPRGNAWNLQGVDLLYSGYNTDNYPQTYNLLDVVNYNNEASDNFYHNFDSKTLDKDSAYVVNMYYKGSPAQERAYKEGRDKMTGTHTGYVTWNPDTNRWEVTHNIHGTIHVDPFILIQGGNKKYGITGIFTPRKDNLLNGLRDILGLGEGGVIESGEVMELFLRGGKSPKKKDWNSYYEFLETLPKNLQKGNDTDTLEGYRMKLLFDNTPDLWTFEDGLKGENPIFTKQEDGYHAPSVLLMPDGHYEFLKSYNHPTFLKEIQWYNSDDAKSFRELYRLKSKNDQGVPLTYYQYVPNNPQAFKQGGQMNVIPEGALHARKNNMKLAKEGEVTHKGVPVVDNDGVQQAEVEKEEWTITKELTDDVESWYKKYYDEETSLKEKDELAIKCGKRIVKELLHNTDDRANLIAKMLEEEE